MAQFFENCASEVGLDSFTAVLYSEKNAIRFMVKYAECIMDLLNKICSYGKLFTLESYK